MKIFLIFIFCLTLGPVSCFDVIGYSGGTVIIYCKLPKSGHKSFCKETGSKCVYLNPDVKQNTWDHNGRVSVVEIPGLIKVTYRNLRSADAGFYQCGEIGGKSDTVNLKVETDKCCSGPMTVIGYPGETVTINCSYPEEFKNKPKFFYKDDFNVFIPIIGTNDHKKDKSSISEDRKSKVISVRISDVREDDEGDYYCGAGDDEGASNYETFFSKVHLKVNGSTPKPPPSAGPPAPPVTTSVIIPVSIVVALLLIGGAALLFFILIVKKRRGSTPPARTNRSGSKEVPAVVSNDEETGLTTPTPPKDQDLTYSTSTPPKDQDLTYSTPTPPKDQDLTYSTVSFHKNPGSPTDASASVRKEEPETEYSTVKRPTALE